MSEEKKMNHPDFADQKGQPPKGGPPPGFDPKNPPPGFDPKKMPPGFDPEKMPKDFDPEKIREAIENGEMPPDFPKPKGIMNKLLCFIGLVDSSEKFGEESDEDNGNDTCDE